MKCPHCHKRINAGAMLRAKRSAARIAASKVNGAKGGRPRKVPVHPAEIEAAMWRSAMQKP